MWRVAWRVRRAQNTVLRTLSLAKMKLGDREGQALGNCLENNTALRALDLSDNDLTEKTAHSLGQVRCDAV